MALEGAADLRPLVGGNFAERRRRVGLRAFRRSGAGALAGLAGFGILAGVLALVLPTFSGLVSLLQLLLMLLILFVPGTNGENRYGPQPT